MAKTSDVIPLNGDGMDIDYDEFDDEDDDDDEMAAIDAISDLGEPFLRDFTRKAATAFFDQYGLISHQINSFNDFIRNGIQRVIDDFGDLEIEPGYDPSRKGDAEWKHAVVRFGKVTIDKPQFWAGDKLAESGKGYLDVLPRHARLQNMTYASRMKVTVSIRVYIPKLVSSDKFKTGKEQSLQHEPVFEETKEVLAGRIPIMVKSDLCWMSGAEKDDCDFDLGGYFIVKGAEKTFIAQEQISLKKLWISNTQGWTIACRSAWKRKRLYIKLSGNSQVEDIKGGEKVLTIYFLSTEIPLWILFFALGVKSDKEVVDLIDYGHDDSRVSNVLLASIYEADEKCEGFRRAGKALSYVDKNIKSCKFPPTESISECFNNYLFPTLSGAGNKVKARFLAYMVRCLLEAYTGRRKCDSKDDFKNKRLDMAGELLEREIRVQILNARRRMLRAIQRDLYADRNLRDIENYLDASIITNGLQRAFSTGAWSHPFKAERISGVVATLRRQNPLQTVSDMRKLRQQVNYTGKVGDARYPHPSHWGKVCFLSTPDGENCGLVKNLAATGLVTINISESLYEKLLDWGMQGVVDDTSTSLCGKVKVFLNGDWIGVCEDSLAFVTQLRNKRRHKEIPPEVEIKRDEHHGEVRMYSDAGRVLRPLLVVENLKKIPTLKGSSFTFQNLLDKGIIELIGAEEEEDCCTAWGIRYILRERESKNPVKYTHCELDMSFLLGLSCGIIPFANHDHARRVLYESEKHSQQGIGFSTTNPNIRVDTLSHQLYYPQRPLFRTFLSDCLGEPELSLVRKGTIPKPEYFNGQNAIVAINVHLGYNQEDSLVMNRASLERGMFRSEHIRSYKADVDNKESYQKNKKPEDSVNFGKIQSKIGRVDSLDDDGLPFVGANLQSGDIVIGRCAESGADHSIKLKHTERGMVQKVVLSANDEGKNYAVVSLRQVRSPCLGDKFASMHGQKGVLGFLESQENFVFTRQGIVPDVVINPHAFPSRQTPGQILEAALGKGIACGGPVKYATPFSTPSIEDITNQLHRVGFARWGNERVYDGRTGKPVESLIFIGPTFYQRLIHMAEDKVKFRNTGPVHPLTRQPVADRKRFGGIKFGEMERDCLIAHGASANLHERLFTLSDSSQMHICQKCKNIANVIQRALPGGRKIRGPHCRFCKSSDDIVKVNVPYGAKLLCQELFSMGICLKFDTRLC
ncbi:DNA-directed RNA polymerases IV and V subunit 2-like [Punica granatum]|uniref:DNA-directed RNA polymerase subunit beta n=3 Tax=Punica granatum TaxID=22663 RepID=A0A218XWP3_PUNGR|nr:DNA-directed RNA polymerases IV and V subunit 2-like [Punica granatum]OWM89250.1 hypothetical protein CDL15_Pgr010537 [Punica granatum]